MSSRTQMFIEKIKPGALQLWSKFGVLPSVAMGQAILESAWGESSLAIKYNNLFGIKGTYQGNSAMLNTWEVYGGKRYDIHAGFRVYPDWSTSILDYGVFLTVNKRYKNALHIKEYGRQIDAIHQAGYATDPDYANKVRSIIEKHKLYEADELVLGGKPKPVINELNTTTYKVRTGDTLSHIAERFNTSVKTLALANNIEDEDLIFSGQVLIVPDTEKQYYIVKPGDNLTKIAKEKKTTVKQLIALNKFANPSLIYAGSRIRIK